MLKLVPLALIQSIFLCGGQIMLKLGLARSGPFSFTWAFFRAQITNWWYLGCGVSFGVATVLWMYILKHFPFSVAYPLSCLSYAFGVVAGILIFHEHVTLIQCIGVLLIMAGCVLIAK